MTEFFFLSKEKPGDRDKEEQSMIGPNATTTTTSADGALHYPARAEENANFSLFSLLLILNRRTTCALCNYSGLEEISDYDGNQLQGWQGRLLRFHIYTYTRVAYLEGESQ